MHAPGAALAKSSRLQRQAYRAYRAADYRGAVVLLLRLLDRDPTPEVHRALAACFLKLGEDKLAVVHLKKFLDAGASGEARKKALKRLRQAEQRLRSTVARISSDPSGASIHLDDATEPMGITPLATRLPVGEHRLRLSLEGYREVRRAITLKRGVPVELKFVLTKELRRSVLIISANVKDVRVTVDGKPVSPGEVTVDPGAHLVRVEKEGHLPWESSVVVDPGGRAIASALLRKKVIPPPAPQPIQLPAPVPRPAPAVRLREEAPPRPLRWAAISTAAAAGAALLSGIVFQALQASAAAAARNAASVDDLVQHKQAQSTRHALAVTSFVLAGAAAAASGLLFYLDYRRGGAREDVRASLAPVPSGAMATVQVRY